MKTIDICTWLKGIGMTCSMFLCISIYIYIYISGAALHDGAALGGYITSCCTGFGTHPTLHVCSITSAVNSLLTDCFWLLADEATRRSNACVGAEALRIFF